jgi:hypothetical protein
LLLETSTYYPCMVVSFNNVISTIEISVTWQNYDGSELKKDIWNNESQDRQRTYKTNIAERFQNHCCCGKANTYSECICGLSYPACTTHVPYYIVFCGLSGSTTFFHIISQMAWFSGKKVTEHKMYVLSWQLLTEKVLILRRIVWNMITEVYWRLRWSSG